jgi:hypothetical protein
MHLCSMSYRCFSSSVNYQFVRQAALCLLPPGAYVQSCSIFENAAASL